MFGGIQRLSAWRMVSVLCIAVVGCGTGTLAEGRTRRSDGGFPDVAALDAFSIASPAESSFHQSRTPVLGTCRTGSVVSISGDVLPVGDQTCVDNMFAAMVTLDGIDDLKEIIVEQHLEDETEQTIIKVYKDTSTPQITIESPASDSQFGRNLTLSGRCESGLPIVVNAEVPASNDECNEGRFSIEFAFGMDDGTKTITLSQTDAAGNIGQTSGRFVNNSLAPSVRIDAPASAYTRDVAVQISGDCTVDLPLNIAGDGIAPTATSCGPNGRFHNVPVNFTPVDGTKTITATQTNANGTSSNSIQVVRDTIAPAVAFHGPATDDAAQGVVSLDIACEAGLAVTFAGDINAAPADCTQQGRLLQNVTLSGADGSKVVTVSQTDAAGNRGSASTRLVKDTTAPDLAVLSPQQNQEVRDVFQVEGRCEPGLPIETSGQIEEPALVSCGASWSFSASVNLAGGEGPKTISLTQVDAAGNRATTTLAVRKVAAPACTDPTVLNLKPGIEVASLPSFRPYDMKLIPTNVGFGLFFTKHEHGNPKPARALYYIQLDIAGNAVGPAIELMETPHYDGRDHYYMVDWLDDHFGILFATGQRARFYSMTADGALSGGFEAGPFLNYRGLYGDNNFAGDFKAFTDPTTGEKGFAGLIESDYSQHQDMEYVYLRPDGSRWAGPTTVAPPTKHYFGARMAFDGTKFVATYFKDLDNSRGGIQVGHLQPTGNLRPVPGSGSDARLLRNKAYYWEHDSDLDYNGERFAAFFIENCCRQGGTPWQAHFATFEYATTSPTDVKDQIIHDHVADQVFYHYTKVRAVGLNRWVVQYWGYDRDNGSDRIFYQLLDDAGNSIDEITPFAASWEAETATLSKHTHPGWNHKLALARAFNADGRTKVEFHELSTCPE